MPGAEWGGSLHQTFRLLPDSAPHLRVFLESEGRTEREVLDRLPYDRTRIGATGTGPDRRRYRDSKFIFQAVGLLYEEGDSIHLTDLGLATQRWLSLINEKNSVILARHAAYALAACQLRNPSRPGQAYPDSVLVHPFKFIWKAMLQLDGRLSTPELNRAIFRVTDDATLVEAIAKIRAARDANDVSLMGDETITGHGANDRVIPWMSLASFGWTLFADKRAAGGEFYRVMPHTHRLLADASQMKHAHRVFPDMPSYVRYISDCASLPKDIR